MFHRRELIRFQHCDPAGIVFYPRYVEMINATIEDWFAEIVGVSFSEIHGHLNAAIPVVSLSVNFIAPTRLGEILEFELSVERLGTSSMAIAIKATNCENTRFEAKLTLVHISKGDYRPRPWPKDLREKITAEIDHRAL